MARVLVAPAANADLDQLISSRDLPWNTRARVKARLAQLAAFPRRGQELTGGWQGFRYIQGPWPWMLIIYAFDQEADRVNVVTIQDARTANAATADQ